jgi:rod shape-determining protein MreC
MKQYVTPSYRKANNSFKHGFFLIFKKIETVLFTFLCLVFLIGSQISDNLRKVTSSTFINVSLPVVRVAAFPINVTISLLTEFSELTLAKKENESLRDELQKLKVFYVKLLNVSQENKELRDSLNFVSLKSSTFKVATVLGKTGQVFGQKILIDAGKNREVEKGRIVTTIQGVIGRVDEVFETTSRLILINDATSRVPIIASKARVRGILAGNGSGLMEILYLPRHHKIEVGDLIFTSGDGDTLPSGLFIGTVKKVDEESAFVAMAQDVSAANVVTIVGF